jgi:hypothetical protein
MFHVPAHHAATAAQFAINFNAKVDCPNCGGWGDTGIEQESGCRYACYSCGMSGKVSLDAAYEQYVEETAGRAESDRAADLREAQVLAAGGYYDQEGGWVDVRPVAKRQLAAPVYDDGSDDLPF